MIWLLFQVKHFQPNVIIIQNSLELLQFFKLIEVKRT